MLLLNIPELLLWEFLSTRLWLMRGGSNTYKQSPSCVKSGNFITKTQHEDRKQVDTVTDKYRMNVRHSRLKLNSFYMQVPADFTRLDVLGISFD